MPVSLHSPPALLLAAALVVGATGCQTAPRAEPLRAIEKRVDLPRFMGDWYVIAHIPTFIETKAYNAVERYQLDPDGSIATTFFFNQGATDGPLKTYRPRGFIHNRETNAEWRMQFIWPLRLPYLILHLDEAYETTIIGVPNRKYAWIMARTPSLPPESYDALVRILAETGHDLSKLRRVPHAAAPTPN
jgi:apolipoprotein D and lipocalin family protein